MKRFLTCLLATTAFASSAIAQPTPAPATAPAAPSAPAPAASLPDADPALWVVRDEDTTIYLFGTFHMLDGRPWFNDEVRQAFDQSSELVVEVLLPEDPAQQQQMIAPLIMQLAVDSQGRTLSSRLTPQEVEALNGQLSALGVPPGAFDRFEPWFVNLTLTQVAASRMNLNPANGPETILRRAAEARNMRLGELETAEFQVRMLDSVPDESQLQGLKMVLADPDISMRMLQPMLAAWSSGNVDELARVMVESMGAEDQATYDIMFTNRNANWTRWIADRLGRPGTVFIAVGAGHLAGRGSVQEQLRQRNINSTRVPHVDIPEAAAGTSSGATGTASGAPQSYPRCSRTVTDRCQQRGGR